MLAVQPQLGPARLLDANSLKRQKIFDALASQKTPDPDRCNAKALASSSDEADDVPRELAFSPGGEVLFATYAEQRCVSFDPCGACAESYLPARVDPASGKLLGKWDDAGQRMFAACSAALGAPVTPGESGGAVTWSSSGHISRKWRTMAAPASECAVGKNVLVLLGSRMLTLHDLNSTRVWPVQMPGDPRALAISPDGKKVLAATHDAVLMVDVANGEILETLPLRDQGDGATSVAFAPDGQAFAVGTEKGVVLEFGLR